MVAESTTAALQPCPGCGVRLAPVDGPADPYSGASPACWAAYGQVLAREFQELAYPDYHRYTADAYMAQHPGYATAAGRRSVVVHLVGLCLAFDETLPVAQIGPRLGRVFPTRADVEPLLPIPALGAVTVESVLQAGNATEHAVAVEVWARAVWAAWVPHHERIRAFARLTAATR